MKKKKRKAKDFFFFFLLHDHINYVRAENQAILIRNFFPINFNKYFRKKIPC